MDLHETTRVTQTPSGPTSFLGRRAFLGRIATLVVGGSFAGPHAARATGRLVTRPSASRASHGPGGPFRLAAVLPVTGSAAPLAKEELLGITIAVDLVNEDGGVAGIPLALEVVDLERGRDAPRVMEHLVRSGIHVVLGSNASELAVPASRAAAEAGLVYWETGAVADRLTEGDLPSVFRVGADGTTLGRTAIGFLTDELAGALGRPAARVRLAVVHADDEYARSVAEAAVAAARDAGVPVVVVIAYDMLRPAWGSVMRHLREAAPDVLAFASHIPDGIAFRRQMLEAGLRVDALIGTTMAQCSPDFARDLGPDAVGVFACDRPTGGFRPDALAADARTVHDRLVSAWLADPPPTTWDDPWSDGDEPAAIQGPLVLDSPSAGPTEEGLSGFTAAWALLHHVLPAAVLAGGFDRRSIVRAARAVDLPDGTLPNGAGLRFSSERGTMGQNQRAVGVVWQWQAERRYAFVYPPDYATAPLSFVPLAR